MVEYHLENDDDEEDSKGIQPEFSFNSVIGITSPRTIKLTRVINNGEVVVMDSWWIHSGVEVTSSIATNTSFWGILGYRGISSRGSNLQVRMLAASRFHYGGGFLTPGNSDMNSGLQWLEKLGTI